MSAPVLPPLVTLEQAKQQLRITDSLHDADVQEKLTQAQDAVIRYLDADADPTWTPQTVPFIVLAAIERYMTHLYEHRGDDMNPSGSGATPDADVWEANRRLLAPLRLQAIGTGKTTP
jgi:Phage gp6-like head-tail connector protein